MSTELLGRLLAHDASVDLRHLDVQAALDTASAHGVVQLLEDALADRADAPASLMSALGARARQLAAADMVREHELRGAITAWDAAGLAPVLVKGAALAYDVYRSAQQRPRLDTDVLIRVEDRAALDDVLTARGYRRQRDAGVGLVMSQVTYVAGGNGWPTHAIDVHWRIANPQLFADVVTYDELRTSSVALPRLAAAARGPASVPALLLACVHRVAHHRNHDRLIWFYDIRLLADRLDDQAWQAFVRLARDRGVAAVCADSLTRAVRFVQARVPADVVAALADGASSEPTAVYLAPQSPVERAAADMKALPTWRGRLQLLHDYVFPPSTYMRDVYAPQSRAPLAVLYARRALSGARRWFTRA